MSVRPSSKPENLVLNLVFNVAIPTAILTWGDAKLGIPTRWALLVALAFPIAYGTYDFVQRRRLNFISVIGFASVLISGGFGLMELDGFWFSIKEAAIPGLIGIAVLASMNAKAPIVHEMLYNPQVIDVEKVDRALDERGNREAFKYLMRASSILLAFSFFVSACLNYGLARYLLKSPPGTPEFNHELGRMHLLSWPVIVVPSMAMMMIALWRLMKGLQQLTGLTLDEILKGGDKKAGA